MSIAHVLARHPAPWHTRHAVIFDANGAPVGDTISLERTDEQDAQIAQSIVEVVNSLSDSVVASSAGVTHTPTQMGASAPGSPSLPLAGGQGGSSDSLNYFWSRSGRAAQTVARQGNDEDAAVERILDLMDDADLSGGEVALLERAIRLELRRVHVRAQRPPDESAEERQARFDAMSAEIHP